MFMACDQPLLMTVLLCMTVCVYVCVCVLVCPQELCDLLRGLLQTDSSARLSIPQVQATTWFQGFDWQALQDKTLTPPRLPTHA
jgi:hypothetical protein